MNSKLVNGVILDCGKKMTVPDQLELAFVFQCGRGFWWGKKGKTRLTSNDKIQMWNSEKIPLHIRSPKLEVLRTPTAKNWQIKVYEVEQIEIVNTENVFTIEMPHEN